MSETRWATFQSGGWWSRLWCDLTGGHEWRYHLREPARMCEGCHTKQAKIPARITIPVNVLIGEADD